MARTIDTRFFLTHYLADTDELKAKTTRRMSDLQRESAIVPTIVLHEIYKFMHDNVGRDVAQLRIDGVLNSNFVIVDLTPTIAITSAVLRCKYKDLPTADSIVAATGMETKSRRVVSDDPHFEQIRELKREWL